MHKKQHLALSYNYLVYKGYSRSAVFEKEKGQHWYLPNEWAEILMNPEGFKLEELTKKLPTYKQEEIQNDLLFLRRNNIITPTINLTTTDYQDSTNISNYFIDYCSITISNPVNKTLFNTLQNFQTKRLELYFNSKSKSLDFIHVLSHLNFESIAINLDYNHFKKLNLNELAAKIPKLATIRIINTPFNHSETLNRIEIHKIKKDSNHQFNFKLLKVANNDEYNQYYRGRIHINADGTIKNAPNAIKTYGTIYNTDINDVFNSQDFQEIWKAKKSKVDVCSDCEFRGICIDKRPLKKRPNGTWYSTEDCNYNPYLNSFKGEDNYLTLKECGVESSKQGFKILVDQFIAVKTERPNAAQQIDLNQNLL